MAFLCNAECRRQISDRVGCSFYCYQYNIDLCNVELLPIGIKLGSRLENRLHIIYPPDFLVQRKEYVDESGWAAISQLLQFIDRFYLLLLYPYKAKFWEITLSLLCREKDSKNKHVSVPLYFGADRRYLHQQRASSLETGAE